MANPTIHAVAIVEQHFQSYETSPLGGNGIIQVHYSEQQSIKSDQSSVQKHASQLILEAYDCKGSEPDPEVDKKLMEALIKIELSYSSGEAQAEGAEFLRIASTHRLLGAMRSLLAGTTFHNVPLPASV